MEYAFCEAVKNPMDNGLTNQVPPVFHHWQYFWSTRDVKQNEDYSY